MVRPLGAAVPEYDRRDRDHLAGRPDGRGNHRRQRRGGGGARRRHLDRQRRRTLSVGVAVGRHRQADGVPDHVSAAGDSSSPRCRLSRAFRLFTVVACVILLCYGGGFGTMPAFAADRFGAENVGSIYGLMLTAWSFAGVLGPMLIAAVCASTTGRLRRRALRDRRRSCSSARSSPCCSAGRDVLPSSWRRSRRRPVTPNCRLARSITNRPTPNGHLRTRQAEAASLPGDGKGRVGEPRSAAVRVAHSEGRRLRRLRARHVRPLRLDASRRASLHGPSRADAPEHGTGNRSVRARRRRFAADAFVAGASRARPAPAADDPASRRAADSR